MMAVSMNTRPSIRVVRILASAAGGRAMPSADVEVGRPKPRAPPAAAKHDDRQRQQGAAYVFLVAKQFVHFDFLQKKYFKINAFGPKITLYGASRRPRRSTAQ